MNGIAEYMIFFGSTVILVLTGFIYGYEYGRKEKEREMAESEAEDGNVD